MITRVLSIMLGLFAVGLVILLPILVLIKIAEWIL